MTVLYALALAAAQPSIDAADWLRGCWAGQGLGGEVEECWSAAADGQMVGHFQLVKGGKPQFYEILLIDARPPGLRMRVKHFNADFTAWEDKGDWHSFEPVAVAPNKLSFNGLELERRGDELMIVVTLKHKDGSVADHTLRLRRKPF